MSPADALAGFLCALGVPGHDIPAEETERAARYRALVAGRRMLVLLDNAGSAEQVRPLLPASPACLTLVTSRDTLAGLVARDGARRLDLDLLSAADASILLTTLIGDRAAADPTATPPSAPSSPGPTSACTPILAAHSGCSACIPDPTWSSTPPRRWAASRWITRGICLVSCRVRI
jgi:hypothetical protein